MGKLAWLEDAVANAYCTMDIFWENVGFEKEEVLQRVREATTPKMVEQIMNEYI